MTDIVNWSQARVPEEFAQSHVDYVRPLVGQPAIQHYQDSLRLDRRLPLLIGICGDVGTGKTTIAVELLRAASKYSIRYTTMEAMLRSAESNKFSWDAFVEDYEAPAVLVIDDVHNASQPWRQRHLVDTVIARWNARRWTILVATCSLEDFAGIIGPSVADRMFNPVLVLKGKSYRQR